MAEYLIFRMTGEKRTVPSLASRTTLFAIEGREWDEKFFRLEAGQILEQQPTEEVCLMVLSGFCHVSTGED